MEAAPPERRGLSPPPMDLEDGPRSPFEFDQTGVDGWTPPRGVVSCPRVGPITSLYLVAIDNGGWYRCRTRRPDTLLMQRAGRSPVEAKLGSGPPCLVKFCMSVSSS